MIYFLITIITYLLYIGLKYRRSYYMLQQNSYNTSNRYIKWIFKNPIKVLITKELLFIILIISYYFINVNAFKMLFACMYLYLFYDELKNIKRDQNKKPFKFTSRVKRLSFTTIIPLIVIITLICFNFNINNILIYYIILALYSYLSYFITYIVNIINIPMEVYVYYHYRKMAINKLNGMHNLIKIGITGSYGKTTSKNILNTILNTKYNSMATKKSFNTPYGLMMAINNDLDKFDDVFIAEMGACKRYDIQELCDLVHPKYGILTCIGLAHLETFKTIENTAKTKFELIEALPKDGIGILNKDDEYQVNYRLKNNCKIIWIGIDNDADVKASNLEITSNGMSFYVNLDNKNYHFETTLLGRANIYNILGGIALGYELGVSPVDLIKAVKSLRPTEHRLELKKLGDITIIDDAFNSNPTGSKMALEVLSLMKGKRIVVTPGMIELGSNEYYFNKKFGEYIADVADAVILVGEKQTKPILEGLKNHNYNEKNIFIINDVRECFSIINKIKDNNTYVLLENDLPDIFNE